MGKVKGKHRLDKYYHLAKEHGYRSRAAWKLVQLDSKHSFLGKSRSVLDLCAAPGGWMQVAVQRMPVASFVVGVDLVPIRPIRGAISFEADITTPKCRAFIKKLMAQHGVRAFDLILHDGSPNIGGAWASEATCQNALVVDSIKLATEFLAPKGTFITKVFRSQDYNSVRFCLNQLFERVESDKPLASRSASAETYLLGFKYKAPAKIDPRLLDMKHLFEGATESKRSVDVLTDTKQKRHRDGYPEGNSTLRAVGPAAEFIWSETPVEYLGSVTSMSFDDPASLPLKDHVLTTSEVKILCEDLGVIGKQDFKHLLKWRLHIRKALMPQQKADPAAKNSEKVEVDEDVRLMEELDEMQDNLDRKKKREKKLLSKRQAKDKARKATGMQVDALQDDYTDHELFSLSSIKGKKDLVAFDSNEHEDVSDVVDSGSEEFQEEDCSPGDIDSDEERQRYNDKMEQILDESYERYMAKKEGSTRQRKRAKRKYSEVGQLLEGGSDEVIIGSDHDSDKEQGDLELNPLVVPLREEDMQTQEELTAKWFSQDIFAKAVEEGDLGKFDSEDEMEVDKQVNASTAKVEEKMAKPSKGSQLPQKQPPKADSDFEIVPAPDTDSSDDSSSDESEDDVYRKAEILACAKKMLRKRKRENMLDDAYNKYMFHDDNLPRWFLEEEKKHQQPMKPVTKEEINAMKAQFKEIDARPAKKVAQAKLRKKRAAMRKLEKVRKKANSISDQTDLNDRSKGKLIEQLYKRATPKRPEKEYVVAKKGVQVKGGKGKVVVDRRMKKDARSHGMSKQGKGGSKKGKNAKGQKSKGKGSAKAAPNTKRKRGKK